MYGATERNQGTKVKLKTADMGGVNGVGNGKGRKKCLHSARRRARRGDGRQVQRAV
jgi:hypothetical protein